MAVSLFRNRGASEEERKYHLPFFLKNHRKRQSCYKDALMIDKMNMSMYEDIDSITKIPSFIRTYIYAITGLLLSGINTPLFITIITDRNFR
uniref:Uncharacterized protein n=1 Tax=Onchocerca volvulus TaxID=6282 RepID=A0A8R1XSC2_ONCVO